jgi:hypothetical protein
LAIAQYFAPEVHFRNLILQNLTKYIITAGKQKPGFAAMCISSRLFTCAIHERLVTTDLENLRQFNQGGLLVYLHFTRTECFSCKNVFD